MLCEDPGDKPLPYLRLLETVHFTEGLGHGNDHTSYRECISCLLNGVVGANSPTKTFELDPLFKDDSLLNHVIIKRILVTVYKHGFL